MPTGTVQFSVDGTSVGGPVTLSGGTATFAISTLAVGLHTVTAVYTPDTGNITGSNGSIGQRVGALATSTTTLSVAPATVMYGDTATLTAVVSPSFATGTVSFYEGATLLGSASLDSTGTAVLPISTLNAGVHTITATYNGDPGVPASTSNPVQLTVTQRTAPGGGPAITVTVNDAARSTTQANPPFTYSAAGQLVNGDTYATAISGTPTYSTAAGTTAGTYAITVTGLTSANYTIAFVPGTLTVTAASTTITLVASPSATQYGDPVTLTATVTSGATGTVSFYDGSVLLGTGAVANGVATLTTSTLAAGTHTITAVYNGDATYASSQSGPATVTVAKKTAPGGGAALTITVQNASREYNTSDPQFNYVVTGTLVNGDTYATAVTGVPAYSAADTPTSSAGSTFPINVSGLSSANYEIAVVPGTLTIVTAPTTTTLTTSTTSAQYGDPVTLDRNRVSERCDRHCGLYAGLSNARYRYGVRRCRHTDDIVAACGHLHHHVQLSGRHRLWRQHQRSGHADHQPEDCTRRRSGPDGYGRRRNPPVWARESRIQLYGHGRAGERRYLCDGSHRRARLLDDRHLNLSGRDLSHIGRGSQLEQLRGRVRERHAHGGQGHAGTEWVGEHHADLFAEPIELWPIGHLHSNGAKRSHRHSAVRGRHDGAGHGSHQWHDGNLNHKYANSGNASGDSGLQRR